MSARPAEREIVVLAGTNGAGKSSIAGAFLREAGEEYYNPDEAAEAFRRADPTLSPVEANARAWTEGRRRLERAIVHRSRFAFETMLGGDSITGLLLEACNVGMAVRVFYIGLASPELHIQRVRKRVALGGHDIPEERIRRRYDASRANLLRLLPHLTELVVYDNSKSVQLESAEPPAPLRVLHLRAGQLLSHCPLDQVPGWAKPIVIAAFRLAGISGAGEGGG